MPNILSTGIVISKPVSRYHENRQCYISEKKQDCSIIKLIISDPLDGTTRVKRYAAMWGDKLANP